MLLVHLLRLPLVLSGLVVLSPGTDITGRELPATALKHFGERHFDRVINATSLIMFSHGEPCERARLGELAGAIAVFELASTPCTLETTYGNLREAGAALSLVSWIAEPPGEWYNSHDGSRGRETRGAPMPLLEITGTDADALARSAEGGAPLAVRASPSRLARHVRERGVRAPRAGRASGARTGDRRARVRNPRARLGDRGARALVTARAQFPLVLAVESVVCRSSARHSPRRAGSAAPTC